MNHTNSKPIIRHCKNCKYRDPYKYAYCTVRYRGIGYPRLRALFCRFFKKEEEEPSNE